MGGSTVRSQGAWRVSSAVNLVLAATFAASGCKDVSHITTGDMPPPSSSVLRASQFADIPVPRDFVFVPDPVPSLSYPGSYNYEHSQYREGHLLYSGRDSSVKVFEFYKSQMPLPVNGWTMVEERLGADKGELVFEKQGTRSHLKISTKGDETFVLIEVTKAHEG